MSTQTMPVGTGDAIEINQVGGDLVIQGWERAELQARGDRIRIEKKEGAVALTCSGDVVAHLPQAARLSVNGVGGDVKIENISGSVELGLVGGDASLVNLSGPVQLNGPLGGDTHMENVTKLSMGSIVGRPDFNLGERIRQKVEHATRRADLRVKRVEDRGRFRPSGVPAEATTMPVQEPVSEEERMAVLRMLQDKKITSEQAEKLLSALDGST